MLKRVHKATTQTKALSLIYCETTSNTVFIFMKKNRATNCLKMRA